MAAYYNEIDPFAAAWLRELIKAGHIADGKVDERSIEDVKPNELSEFTQCHFFAGIGVWSYALRQAGWSDDKPVWTGSCPCQPFSAAGKGEGFNDERHLWPSFYWLIEQCRPPVIFGEQVASKATGPWFDLVQADLERMDYAFGCVPFPSAGVGAPHIRDRAYWLAYTASYRRIKSMQSLPREQQQRHRCDSFIDRMGNSDNSGSQEHRKSRKLHIREQDRENTRRQHLNSSLDGGMADTEGQRGNRIKDTSEQKRRISAEADHKANTAGPTNGFWANADWVGRRDNKLRPIEPGTTPLVDGPEARVGRLRGYGNAINAEAAKAFIEAAMTCL